MSEIWNLSTLCRCCHADGNFKNLTLPYQGEDKVEIFETMLRETLGISMCPTLEASYTICEDCILQLRDAAAFKSQVLTCEQKLQIYCRNEQFASTLDAVKFEADTDEYTECNDEADFKHPVEHIKMEVELSKEIIHENDTRDVSTEQHSDVPKTNKEREAKNNVRKKENIAKNAKKQIELSKEIIHENDTRDVSTEQHSDVSKTTKEREAKNNVRKKENIAKNAKKREKRETQNSSLIIKVDSDSGRQFSCKDCGGLYRTQKLITQHISEAHKTSFKCEYCSKTFKTSLTYKNHLKQHTKKKTKCTFCPKKFLSTHSLNDHLNSHTKEEIYKCDLCQKEFQYKQSLIKHLRVHDGTNKKRLCDICGRSFNDITNLNAHIKTVHEKLRPFNCEFCSKTYTSKRHLKDHMRIHNDDQDLHKCDICGHTLNCQKSMEIHRLRHDNKFMCRFCSKIFDSMELRREHIRNIHHVVQKEHSCPLCGKVFIGKYSLNRHINDHKGIKNFSCNICGQKFSQKGSLIRHNFRKHNSETDINIGKTKCHICKHSFKNIILHMDSHNKRLFSCDECGKTYTDNSSLNRHKSSKHFGRSFECDVCGKKYIQNAKLLTHKRKVHKIKIEKDSSEGS